MTAVIAFSMLGFVACERTPVTPEPTPDPITEPTYETLEGTEWEGTYATYDQYPGYEGVPITIHWTVDFLKNRKGEVMFWFESQAYDPDQYTWAMTYTFNNNKGVITDENGETPFICDPYNRTMNLDLKITVQYEDGGDGYTYGGPVTLHQIRK